MAGLKIYTLGHSGVIVDMNPIEPSLPEDSLLNAQNANHDAIAARGGALHKRPGLRQFNMLGAGGAILGGIPMSVTGTGGAPTPPTMPGIGSPTGDPTGAPPGGVPGPGEPTTSPGSVVSGGLFGNPFNGARLLVIGRSDSLRTLDFGNSWFESDTKMADLALIKTTSAAFPVGPPSGTRLGNESFETSTSRVAVIINGNLYYPTGTTIGTPPTLPTVRRLSADGRSDKVIFTVPDNPLILAAQPVASRYVSVNAMLGEFGNGDAMYVAVTDESTSGAGAGKYGRVLRVSGLDSGSYSVVEIYNSLNTNSNAALNGTTIQPTVPYALSIFLGGIWFGTWRGASGLANGPTICELQIDPSQPDGWKQSNVLINSNVSAADVSCITSIAFLGKMYVGYTHRGAGITFGTIYSFSGSPSVPALALTGGNGGALGAAADPNGFMSMVVFNGVLFASYFNNPAYSYIYSTPDGVTWSIVWTGSVGTGTSHPLSLQVDNGVLYAFGSRTPFSGGGIYLWSTDGVTFTDATTKFPNVNSGASVPVLFGMEQS